MSSPSPSPEMHVPPHIFSSISIHGMYCTFPNRSSLNSFGSLMRLFDHMDLLCVSFILLKVFLLLSRASVFVYLRLRQVGRGGHAPKLSRSQQGTDSLLENNATFVDDSNAPLIDLQLSFVTCVVNLLYLVIFIHCLHLSLDKRSFCRKPPSPAKW